jgi:hypothetical protein
LQTFARLTENIQLLDVLDEQNRQQSQQQASPLMQMMAQAGQQQDGGQGQPEGQQGGQPEGQPVGQVTTDQQVMDKAKKKEGNLEKKVAAERGVGV